MNFLTLSIRKSIVITEIYLWKYVNEQAGVKKAEAPIMIMNRFEMLRVRLILFLLI
jgi:hypothetical protein